MSAQYETYNRVWQGKDNLPRELHFIQPLSASDGQVARVMVGARQHGNAADPTSQSLAASGIIASVFSANTLVAGSWTPPPAGCGVMFEALRAAIICNDASGNLQITAPIILGSIPGVNCVLNFNPCAIPFTFPKIANISYQLIAQPPLVPYLPPDGAYPNGPSAQFGLANTDAANPHTYQRTISYIFRYIYDIDYSKERVYVTGTLT